MWGQTHSLFCTIYPYKNKRNFTKIPQSLRKFAILECFFKNDEW